MIEISNLLDGEELSAIYDLLDSATWSSGSHSAGQAASKHKRNEEMDQSCAEWKKINALVVSKLYQHHEFKRAALPSKVSAAFISRYSKGMQYGPHIDNPIMGSPGAQYRSDVACTVFLNDPSSYDGGELSIRTPLGPVDVKLNAGSAVVYPASSIHEVLPVTNGERIVCALWAQSLIVDAQKREILAELDDARMALQQTLPEAKVTQSVDHAYSNLIRLWAKI